MAYSVTLVSQNYTPFFSTTTQYNIVNSITCKKSLANDAFASCVATNEYFLHQSNQVTFNDKIYFVPQAINGELFTPGNINAEGLLIREDTTLGRIYRYFPSIDNEIMVCDMSLNQGDTFQLYTFINESSYLENFYIEEGTQLVVDTVTYVDGKKIIHFPNISFSTFYNGLFWQFDISIKFIEGVGPTYGPFGFINILGFEKTLPLLLCVEKNNQLVYMQHSELTCYLNSVKIEEEKIPEISIFPNPTRDILTVNVDPTLLNQDYQVFSITGQLLLSSKLTAETSEIELNSISEGVYLLQIGNQSKKFVKVN